MILASTKCVISNGEERNTSGCKYFEFSCRAFNRKKEDSIVQHTVSSPCHDVCPEHQFKESSLKGYKQKGNKLGALESRANPRYLAACEKRQNGTLLLSTDRNKLEWYLNCTSKFTTRSYPASTAGNRLT